MSAMSFGGSAAGVAAAGVVAAGVVAAGVASLVAFGVSPASPLTVLAAFEGAMDASSAGFCGAGTDGYFAT